MIIRVRALAPDFPLPVLSKEPGRECLVFAAGFKLVKVPPAFRDQVERNAGSLKFALSMDMVRPIAADLQLDAPNDNLNGFWAEESALV